MLGVKAHHGIGMKNLGYGNPLNRQSLQELPGHPTPLTATSNYMQPAFAYLETKTPEAGEIAGYRVIVEVALDHAPQPFPAFRPRLLHTLSKRHLHLLQLGEESRPNSFTQHEELPILPGFPANVRKP